ncbi:zinc finger protein 99-like isoform X3 [Maniola jurtina]|uniref:zinc finger protein 99-like isoform X3 n=1 Tax=Maniola jurtina TaxID=191418 RepID=UPI001E68BAF1|nr:zinc finger protein 99-like isoform X3 [Maniola jurtina]
MEFNATKKAVPRSAGPSKAQFCMICLDTSKDCKLYPVNKYNLDIEFENLTGISLQGKLYFVPQFCTICAQRLSNCSKLRDKCLRAYHLLLGLVEINKLLTTQNIKTLNRSNNLTSSMGKRSFQPDHCDLYLIHQEQEPEVPEIPHSETIKIEVKLLDTKLILNPNPKNENNLEEQVAEMNEPKTEKMDNIISDVEFVDEINDIVQSDTDIDIDTHSDKRIKDKVDKFMNDVMNDTDNDWDFLKDSFSDTDSDSGAVNKAITVNAKATTHEIKENNKRLKRKLVRRKAIDPATLEYLKQYKITELTPEEQLADIQKRKDKENFKNSPYKCMTCFKGALNIDTYNAHMERHTDKYGKSICSVCGLHFKSNKAVRSHVINTHSVRYSCNTCPLVTNHKVVAKNHAGWHKGTTYKCLHCPEELHSKTAYFSHLRIAHPTDVVCTLCGFSFINERGLGVHLNLKHHGANLQDVDGPLCEECNIRFASVTAYRQHMEVSFKHATGGRPKRNTPKQKPENANYNKRYQMYKHKPVLTCEECGMQMEGYRSYYRHFRFSHPGKTRSQFPVNYAPCLCEQCGKSFTNRYLLKDHMLQHSGKKEFQCDVCKKSFFLKFHLVTHLKTHSEDQPTYECPVCQKKFVNKANCNRHIWTHKDHKPHKCQACDKTYVNSSTLRSHVEHVHLKKPYPKKSRGPRLRASRARHTKEAVCGTIWPKPEHASTGVVAEFPD